MYQAEHLELVTQVTDQFSSPLTRLSAHLETAAQQANRLDPIYIRVIVNDQQLRNLNRRMAQGQIQDVAPRIQQSDGIGSSVRRDHVGRSASDRLVDNMSDLTDTLSDFDTDLGQTAAMGVGGAAAMSRMDAIVNRLSEVVPDGGGGDSGASFSAITPQEITEEFGLPITELSRERSFRPAAMLRGESPFQVPTDELEEFMSPKAFTRALDVTDIDGVTSIDDLVGLGPQDLADELGTDVGNIFPKLADHVDETTLQFEQLKESFFDIRIGMTQFYDFLAAAVPIMFVFLGSIPAIVGALGGLAAAAVGAAGALAGIAGLGLFGAAVSEAGGDFPGLEDFRDLFDGLGEEFQTAFGDLASEFEGLVTDAIDDGLPRFFHDMSRAAETFIALQPEFRAFGQFMSDFAVGTVETLARLGDAASPVFEMMADGLRNRDVIEGFAGALVDVLPHLSRLTTIALDALPALQSFSEGMLTVFHSVLSVYNVIMPLVESIFSLRGVLGDGYKMIGQLVAGLFVLMSSVFLTTKISEIFRAQLFQLASQMGLTSGYTKMFASVLRGEYAMSTKLAATKTFLLKKGVVGLIAAFKTLLATIGIGVAVMAVGHLATEAAEQFGLLGGNIDDATDSLREFERQQSRMGGSGAFMGDLDSVVYADVTDETNVTFNGETSEAERQRTTFYVQNEDAYPI